MTNEIDDDEMQEFKIEMEDLLSKAEDALLKSTETNFRAMYDVIFRSFHSIKGASGMLGFDLLQNHFHRVENIFQNFKTRNNITGPETNFFLTAIDASRDILKGKKIDFNYEIEEKKSEKTKDILKSIVVPESTGTPVQKSTTKNEDKNLIYIIDDEKDILEILSEILKSEGYETRLFSSPIGVIDEMGKEVPALILSDVKMSPVSGSDLLKMVREFYPTLPFIFISGELKSEILMTAIKDNISDVIEKPFNSVLVLNTVKNILEKKEILELLNKSIEIILFQFKDFYQYLLKEHKPAVAEILKQDILSLLKSQKKIFNKI